MEKDRWQQIKDLFEAARGLSGEERKTFLAEECVDDSSLRAEVEKLINSFEEADTSFLEEPAEKEVISQILEQETQALNNKTTGEIKPGAFIAGTVLDERYRIIGLLGKGGMGEVYKAEDLKLNQMVALKFLPEKLEKNEDALKRFIGEVRTARQVSHPNVCRVFDIGETGGKHFLSMEFIEGDDLSQLLNRIGRLPSDKATEISRQICFGLHAIHDAGILHRDLKPANIIIDSKGKARITDFGIAGIEEEISSEEIRVGTPAYMSPEQITGKEVTPRSDIYSLGLLLYEIYTGKQAFKADSLSELIEKHKTTQPANPSEFVENIEPIVEKIIKRCLEKDARDRPNSALQVALAMPGGNPLEAAIAAGETPSPEMVAAASKKGALKPLIALGVVAAFLVFYFGALLFNQTYKAFSLTPFEKPPEVLADRSKQIIQKFGYPKPPVDAEYEFVQDNSFLKVRDSMVLGDSKYGRSYREMIRAGQPYNIYFLYRQSPDYLEPVDNVKVLENEPPLSQSGMANVKLDVRGRMVEFIVVPAKEASKRDSAEVNWKDFFAEAGLDLAKFEETESNLTPPVFADKRIAWKGSLADFQDIPIRIEAAEFNGKPVYFKIFAPWDLESGEAGGNQSPSRKFGTVIIILWICIAIIGSIFFAYRNLKGGRGDLRGGLKLAVFLFAVALLGQIIFADHIPTIWGELSVIYEAVSFAVLLAISIGLIYIALEPFIRRSWSEMLISWSRVMAGDFRDPMVGRDILMGGFLGLGHTIGVSVGILIVQLYNGRFDVVTDAFTLSNINGFGSFTATILFELVSQIFQSFAMLFLAYLLYRLTGKKFLGVFLVGFLFFAIQFLFFALTVHWVISIAALINSICLVIALYRFGLLGLISFWFFFVLTYAFPVTFDSSLFYFQTSVLTVVITLGIIFYAAYVSIAGQPVFGKKILKEVE
ncbi:MAG: protein kinase [Pyrinomonadaceae bacterium]